jgi:hypothetical protein
MKTSPRLCSFLILVVLYHLETLYAQKPSEKPDYSVVHANDKEIVALIKNDGIGSRFRILDIAPEEQGFSGTVTWRAYEPSDAPGKKYVIFDAETDIGIRSPSGQAVQTAPGSPLMPSHMVVRSGNRVIFAEGLYVPSKGEGAIIRFIGQIPFEGCIFDGSVESPLTFAVMRGNGFVYLHGKGTVVLKDGKEIKLP